MNGNDFERYPDLIWAALGLPPWAMRLRMLISLNGSAAIVLVVIVGFVQSLCSGLAYAGIYFAGSFIVRAVASRLAAQGSMRMLASIVVGTIVHVALNLGLALHFFGIWSPLGKAY